MIGNKSIQFEWPVCSKGNQPFVHQRKSRGTGEYDKKTKDLPVYISLHHKKLSLIFKRIR